MEKVIFDTNRLYNKLGTTFLASTICKLESFQKATKILIPDIVIGELENKYKRDFEEEKEKFVKTILNSFLSHDADQLSQEEKITQLKENETIIYEVIELKNTSVLFEMKNLALKKEPPFKKGVKEDPGFKDAYIYFTILEYLQTCTDKYIFVCTVDGTLKESLQKHQKIKVIKDFEEFKQLSISSNFDDYFISKINESIDFEIKAKNIIDYWLSINGNQILLIENDNEKYVIEVDNREIISFCNTNEYINYIDWLIKSSMFSATHSYIKRLNKHKNYLSDDEIISILEASVSNNQIYYIRNDEDVKQFISELFIAKKEVLEEELRKEVEQLYT